MLRQHAIAATAHPPPRLFLFALGLAAGLAAASHQAKPADAPAEFIQKIGNQGLAVLHSGAGYGQKLAYFSQLLRQDFDPTGISRFALGPYWRTATPAQRGEFASLLEQHLLRVYGERLARAGGDGLQVTGSRPDADGVLVTSRLLRREGPPIAVTWRLAETGGVYKIADVAIGGVSMAMAERVEFSNRIARGGGQIGELLVTLRQPSPARGG